MAFEITEARREAVPVSLYLQGESGNGKTFSALLLARGLVGPKGTIGVIDTEGRRSLTYAEDSRIGRFKHLQMKAPYSPDNCKAAIKAAVDDGWDAIILDSASKEHDGEGGILELAEIEYEAILKRNPNNRSAHITKWSKPKLSHRSFLDYVSSCPVHVICTYRMIKTTDMDAKQTVLSPVAERNTPFSFEFHATVDSAHKATWTRVPEPYRGAIIQGEMISVETGNKLRESKKAFVSGGSAPAAHHDKPGTEKPDQQNTGYPDLSAREENLIAIKEMCRESKISREQIETALQLLLKRKTRPSLEKMTTGQLDRLATEEGFNNVLKSVPKPIAQ